MGSSHASPTAAPGGSTAVTAHQVYSDQRCGVAGPDQGGPSPALKWMLDTRLREAGVEAVYCLARGAPKGPNIPRAQLTHQGPLFLGHGYATHSQTWVGEPTWLGVRSDATHQAPTKVGAPCMRVWWPTWRGSVVTLLTKHLAPKVQAPPAELGVRGDATLQTPAFTVPGTRTSHVVTPRTKHPSRPVSQKIAGTGSSPDHTPRPKRLHLSLSSVNTRSQGRGSGPPFLSGVSGGSAPAVPGGPLGVARKPHPTHAASVGMFGSARMPSPRRWVVDGAARKPNLLFPGTRTSHVVTPRTKHPSRPVSQKIAGTGSSPDHTPRPKRLHLSPPSVNTRSQGRGSGPPFLSGVSGGSAPAVPGGPLGVTRKLHLTHAASVGMFGGPRL
ncbi:hypothetical protein ISCGN_030051 [Ixodes scapularis]